MAENQIDQARLSIAALAACFARSLDDQHPGFLEKFKKQLENCYYEIRDNSELSHVGAMETLSWTNDLIKKLG